MRLGNYQKKKFLLSEHCPKVGKSNSYRTKLLKPIFNEIMVRPLNSSLPAIHLEKFHSDDVTNVSRLTATTDPKRYISALRIVLPSI